MFLIRRMGTEKYIHVVNTEVAISIDLNDKEYIPTVFESINEAKECIKTLCKDNRWQVVVK